jgi:serine/threonine protein kinase
LGVTNPFQEVAVTDLNALESLYFAALEKHPAERPAFLDAVCAGDSDLRAGVERLLAAEAKVGGFLDAPAATAAADPDLRGRVEQLLAAEAKEGGVLDAPTADRPAEHPTATFGSEAATSDRPGRDEHVGAILAAKYKLVEEIGEGGMGSVFMAQQTEPVKRAVAVKVIKAGMDSKAVLARFEAERQALAMMDHPNIARVLDAGTTESGRPFFVMELVKGVPITRYCDERKLTPRQRLELFVPVCNAIQHAHQKGIIHRDIKPSNVLVALYDDRPVPKVIDFGVAKATGPALTDKTLMTGFGAVIGTPEYMSPEQANPNNLDIDTRSDVYALGVLLYELLTGSTPVDRKSLGQAALLEVLRIVREVEAPRPSAKLSTIDTLANVAANRGTEPAKLSKLLKGELDWVLLKALEKDRTRRYETANGLARDLQRYLADELVEARPPSTGYRLKKLVRRHKGQVFAASVVLLVLVAGLAGTTWQAYRAEAARGAAAEKAEGERLARLDAQEKERLAVVAAASEKAANERTQRRLKQIENGVEQFAGLLTGINPRNEERDGPTVYQQLRERAEKAADALDADAVGDPLAVARLQAIYGNTLRELGNAAKGVELLEKARLTQERELGPDNPDILTTLNDLALAYLDAGKMTQAVELLELVRDARVKKPGPEHPSTLTTLHNLALAYRGAGKITQAIELLELVRDARVKKLGPKHPDTLTTLNGLAVVYQDAGKMTQAIELFEQVRDARVKKLGPEHPSTLATLSNLAEAYRVAGRTTQAIELFEQVRDAQLKQLGPEHPSTLTTLNNLAGAYGAAGRTTQAIELFEQVRDAQMKKIGPEHPNTLTTLNNLALAYWLARRLDKSVPLFEELLPLKEKKLGRSHPLTLLTVGNLGMNYKDAGRLAEALPLLEESYRASKKHPTLRQFGPQLLDGYLKAGKTAEAAKLIDELLADARKQLPKDSPQLAGFLAQFSLSLLEAGVFAEAEPLLRECLSFREKAQPDAWTTFNTQAMLGGALLGQKKYAEAEPLLLKGYEGMKQREKTIPPQGKNRLSEAVDRLIELSTATDKPDEVTKWRGERVKYPPAPLPVAPPPREKK